MSGVSDNGDDEDGEDSDGLPVGADEATPRKSTYQSTYSVSGPSYKIQVNIIIFSVNIVYNCFFFIYRRLIWTK